MLSESINLDTISNLKHKMHTALAMLERDFPIALQVIYTTCLIKRLLATVCTLLYYIYVNFIIIPLY